MTWSYSGDPTISDKDAVRFLIGDTDTNDQLIEDEEIEYMIAEENTIKLSAARAAETIAAQFARKADRDIGDYSEKFSQKSQQYFQLAMELKKQHEEETAEKAVPFAGGIDKAQKETQENDQSRVKPAFLRGLMNNDY